MITIEYRADGEAVSDFDAADWLYQVKRAGEGLFPVSTSLPIQLIRLAIVRNEISPRDVTFKYYDFVFQANEYGAIMDWPKGFCDRETAVSEDILRCAMQKRRKERSEYGWLKP